MIWIDVYSIKMITTRDGQKHFLAFTLLTLIRRQQNFKFLHFTLQHHLSKPPTFRFFSSSLYNTLVCPLQQLSQTKLIVLLYSCISMQDKLKINLQVYMGQVSGKQPKLLTSDHTKLLKGYNSSQAEFYQQILSYHISHPFAAFQQHIPKYYGLYALQAQPSITIADQAHQKNTKEWLNHLAGRYKFRNEENKFIVLENLTNGFQEPNIFDIKVGGRNVQGKKHKITKSVSQYFIKLNGCRMNFAAENQEAIFLSKYYLAQITEKPNILESLSLFFFDGQKVLLATIAATLPKLLSLILSIKSLRGIRFISSSLCLLYDAKDPSKLDIRLLDFGRVMNADPGFIDEESIQGLQNVYSFLAEIVADGQSHCQRMKELRKYYSETDITTVPDKKKIKYGDQSPTKP